MFLTKNRYRSICRPLVLLLVLGFGVSLLRSAPSHVQAESIATSPVLTGPVPNPTPEDIIIEPSQMTRGTTRTIIINIRDCPTKKFGDANSVITEGELSSLRDKGIEITSPQKISDCEYSAELKVSDSALIGPVTITIRYKEGDADRTKPLRIRVATEEPPPPGPLVPGLDPQVDVMWSVVPQSVVKDNFGQRVGKLFYCIEVVIGNSTGYDMQIAAVGFQLGPTGKHAETIAKSSERAAKTMQDAQEISLEQAFKQVPMKCAVKKADFRAYMDCVSKETQDAITDISTNQARVAAALQNQRDFLATLPPNSPNSKLPASSYRMTRGSIEHGQFWNLRDTALRIVKALGPLLTGFTPYFHALNKQRNFAEGINILSNPFEKGIELVFPDETIQQLQRLDEQTLRDGMIIHNNRQIRTRTFIPKDILRLNAYRDDPLIVMMALGKLHIVGDLIDYKNRISITSNPTGEVIPPPTVNPISPPPVFLIDQAKGPQPLNLTGTNLSGAIVTSPDSNIVVGNTTTTKTSVHVELTIRDTATSGAKTLNVTTPSGTVAVPITLALPVQILDDSATAFSGDPAFTSFLPKAQTSAPKEFTGKFLQGVKLIPLDDNPIVPKITETDPSGKSFKATFTVPEKLAAGDYKFAIVNPDHPDLPASIPAAQIITVTVKKRGAPVVTADATTKEVPFESSDAKPPKTNPSAATTVTLLVDGANLNDLDRNTPIVQKAEDPKKFALDANSVEPISEKRVRIKLTVPPKTPAGDYHFFLKNEGEKSNEFVLKVHPQDAVTLKDEDKEQTLTIADNGTGSVTLNGENLDGARVIDVPTGWTIAIDAARSISTQLVLNFKAPATFTDSDLTFKVNNTNEAADKAVSVTIHAKHPTATPTPSP